MVSRSPGTTSPGHQPQTHGLAALILCGGGSRRMGADKALLEVDGEALVLRVARRIGEAAAPVLLAPGTVGRLGELGLAEVADASPGSGPLGGLVAGLSASPHPLLAVAAADMPYANPEVMRLLARICADEPWDAALPVSATGPEPLHAVYSHRALPALRAALTGGRLSLHYALVGLRVAMVGREVWGRADAGARFAININTRDDLALLA